MIPFDYESVREKATDARGKLKTKALFVEYADKRREPPLFSLAVWRLIYLEVADPTEYQTALVLIGDWTHWLAIRGNKDLAPIIDGWQQEVEIKRRSQGMLAQFTLASSMAPGAGGAAKWLAEGGFIEDKRLRTKAGKAREEQVVNAARDRAEADAERMGLKVVSGGS